MSPKLCTWTPSWYVTGVFAKVVGRDVQGWWLVSFVDDASTEETVSPTTPLTMVKVLMVIALVRGLLVAALDIGDAFLQVLQREDVVVSAPNWVKVAAENPDVMYWQFLKCLPGQRNAAMRWNEHLTELLSELNFIHMQGTSFRHRERDSFIFAHIDVLLLVASREDAEEIYAKLAKQLP